MNRKVIKVKLLSNIQLNIGFLAMASAKFLTGKNASGL